MDLLPENFCVVDLETSNLDPEDGVILEIGACLPCGAIFEATIHQPVQDGQPAFCHSDKALQVNGWTPERNENAEYMSELAAIEDLLKWLQDFSIDHRAETGEEVQWLFAGKNPRFDWDWLLFYVRKDPRLVELFRIFSRRTIDLHSWAYAWGMTRGFDLTEPGFNTDKLYAALGFEQEPMPHRALAGAQLAMKVFKRLRIELAESREVAERLATANALIGDYQETESALGRELRRREQELEEARREIAIRA
ncbi:MAG: exonuclease domain-containing protein [Verrucomicrobiota bacterium]